MHHAFLTTLNKNLKTGDRIKKERIKKLLEKMQVNGPGRKRDSEARQGRKGGQKEEVTSTGLPRKWGSYLYRKNPRHSPTGGGGKRQTHELPDREAGAKMDKT